MPQSFVKSTKAQPLFLPVLILIFGLAIPAALTQQNLSDLQTVNVEDLFTFRLPAGWSKRSSFNVAEIRGEWAKGSTKLVYVWGHTESGGYPERRQSWMNDYEETMTRLGGRRANIRSFSRVMDGKRMYYAELNVGNWEKGEVQLFMRVEGSDAATIESAKQIFKSVTLPLPSPERPTPLARVVLA
jgi:hypothetical protein